MKILRIVTIVLTMSFLSGAAVAAEEPIYKDGDWWKVKVEVKFHTGVSRSACQEIYPEYTVRIVQGKPKVYRGTSQDEIECPAIRAQLLGFREEGETGIQYLKFPLSVGAGWTYRFFFSPTGARSGRWMDPEHKVLAWERVSAPKADFEAFKIEIMGFGGGTTVYYYSPTAKAIVRYESKSPSFDRTVTLLDLNVSP